MTFLRGANTAAEDTPQAVKQAVCECFEQIKERNKLNTKKIGCIIISCTKDIKSVNPATLLRETNNELSQVAFFCVEEHDFIGAQKLCVRILLITDQKINKTKIKHVYLNGAKNLRSDLSC